VAAALANSDDASDRELALDVVRYVDQQFGNGRVLDRLRSPPGRGSPGVERD